MSSVSTRIVELFDTLPVDDQRELAARLFRCAQSTLLDGRTLANVTTVSEHGARQSIGAWLVENMPRAANETDALPIKTTSPRQLRL